MMWSSQKQQLKDLLVETIQVLCKNSLPNGSTICVEATIGITVNTDDVMVVSFKERIKSDGSHMSLMIADEEDDEQSQSKKTKNDAVNVCRVSSPSLYDRSRNNRKCLVTEHSAVYEQTEIPQLYGSSSRAMDLEANVFDISIADGNTTALHASSSASTELSAVKHRSVPTAVTDRNCTDAVSLSDLETDTKDDVVIFKVEDGHDVDSAVSDVQHFSTEVAAASTRKQKQTHGLPRARFTGGNLIHSHPRRSTSASWDEIQQQQQQHTDGSYQHTTSFSAS